MNKTILSMTKSNNSYPDLLQVFNNLETKLVDNDMEFKMDFRGYLNYDSERK